jgi:hypothetical protein
MSAPTLIAFAETESAPASGGSVTTASVSWQVGDVVLLLAGTEGGTGGETLGTPSTTGSGVALAQKQRHDSTGSDPGGVGYAAVATAASSGTFSISQTNGATAARNVLLGVYIFRGSAGVGNTAISTGSSRTVSLTLLGGADGSVAWVVMDWAAAVPVAFSPSATTHSSGSPGPTASPLSAAVGSSFTYYIGDLDDQPSTGAVGYGVGGAGTGPFTIVSMEAKSGGAAAGAPTPVAQPGKTWLRRFRHRQLPLYPASPAALPPTTDTAQVGAVDWAGIAALSTASVVALATVGGLAWGGVQARSVSDVVNTATVGTMSFRGVQATAGAGITAPTTVGGLAFGGVAATATTGVTSPTTVGGLAWSGVSAVSAADVTNLATVGGLSWSGVQATTTTVTPINSPATVGRLTFGGIAASSVGVGSTPATVGGLSWSGVQATAGTGTTNPAKVGGLAWSGVRASSTSQGSAPASVGGLSWSAIPAQIVGNATSPVYVGSLIWAGVRAQAFAADPNVTTPGARTVYPGPEQRTSYTTAPARTLYTTPDDRAVIG